MDKSNNQFPLKLIFSGFAISLIGTLPFGVLNVTALQISSIEGMFQAILFAFGVVLIELFYLFISLICLEFLKTQTQFFYWAQWFIVLFLLSLSLMTFLEATETINNQKSILLDNPMNRFVLGAFLSAINPIQIPFWLGWNSLLISKGILNQNKKTYLKYIIGVGIGTFTGLAVFIVLGNNQSDSLQKHNQIVEYIIALIFLLTAFWQLFSVLKSSKKI